VAQRHASLRSEPDSTIPDTPIEIATEMARWYWKCVTPAENEKQRRHRLELLAESFLRLTGQTERDSIAPIESANLNGASHGQQLSSKPRAV
jgi:hypothetical protein